MRSSTGCRSCARVLAWLQQTPSTFTCDRSPMAKLEVGTLCIASGFHFFRSAMTPVQAGMLCIASGPWCKGLLDSASLWAVHH